jgi:hypothetical protein
VVIYFNALDCFERECSAWRKVAQLGATVVVISKGPHGPGFRDLRAAAPGSFVLVRDDANEIFQAFSVPWRDHVNYAWLVGESGTVRAAIELRDALLMVLEVLDWLDKERGHTGIPAQRSDDAGLPPSTAAETASVESTFRYVRVGMVPQRAERLTLVLSRSPTRATLRIACQRGPGRVVLDGREKVESIWQQPAVETVYSGPRLAVAPLEYRLATQSGPVNDDTCRELPPSLDLRCLPDTVLVLPLSAEMTRESFSVERLDGWKPNHPERVSGLRCTPTIAGIPWAPQGLTWDPFRLPLFVHPRPSSSGVEWAEEHSDVVQGGAFRWISRTQ